LYALKGGSEIGATDSPLGKHFELYASQIQDITHKNWHPDRTLSNPLPVTIHFELQRDGSVRNVQLIRKSGIDSLDQSVLAAVQDSHYPPLPNEYDKSSAPVEFTFRLNK
jgi:TonB family protein